MVSSFIPAQADKLDSIHREEAISINKVSSLSFWRYTMVTPMSLCKHSEPKHPTATHLMVLALPNHSRLTNNSNSLEGILSAIHSIRYRHVVTKQLSMP